MESWEDPTLVFARPEGALRPNFCVFSEEGERIASGTLQEDGKYIFEVATIFKLHGCSIPGDQALEHWKGGGWVTQFPFIPQICLVEAGDVRDEGGVLAKRHAWMRDQE